MEKTVVLITGGAGFLGQHLIRELQLRESSVAEIRVLDLKHYTRFLSHAQTIPVVSIIGDITERDAIKRAFEGVDCVFHCAAYVSYEYPPNYQKLHEVNVKGTENVISLCREFDVPRLVFTSTAEVSFVPYIGKTCLTVIINQTEKKALPPTDPDKFVFPGYAQSKYDAEKLVLAANGTLTDNGGVLRTVALRPPLMYGEEDERFIGLMVNVAQKMGGRIPKLGGAGGKQQVIYAGNAAWSHICAMKTLFKGNQEISGLPVFVTDDTVVEDATRLCERLTKVDQIPLCKVNWWYIPMVVSFAVAIVAQTVSSLTSIKLPISPCGLISYLSSFIMFSRLRAALHMDYVPMYNEEASTEHASKYYVQLYKSLCMRQAKQQSFD